MIDVCDVVLSTGWVAAAVVLVVGGAALFIFAAVGEWLDHRYERRETLRRFGHVHRWLVGAPVNGRMIESCSCGVKRVHLEGA